MNLAIVILTALVGGCPTAAEPSQGAAQPPALGKVVSIVQSSQPACTDLRNRIYNPRRRRREFQLSEDSSLTQAFQFVVARRLPACDFPSRKVAVHRLTLPQVDSKSHLARAPPR